MAIEAAEVKIGMEVLIDAPENPRLHESPAMVTELAEWGAHLNAPAAATGKFRALWFEMNKPAPRKAVQTGEACDMCGGFNIVRTGTCKTCQDCGDNSGCG